MISMQNFTAIIFLLITSACNSTVISKNTVISEVPQNLILYDVNVHVTNAAIGDMKVGIFSIKENSADLICGLWTLPPYMSYYTTSYKTLLKSASLVFNKKPIISDLSFFKKVKPNVDFRNEQGHCRPLNGSVPSELTQISLDFSKKSVRTGNISY